MHDRLHGLVISQITLQFGLDRTRDLKIFSLTLSVSELNSLGVRLDRSTESSSSAVGGTRGLGTCNETLTC